MLGVAIGRVTEAANALTVRGTVMRDSTAARKRKAPELRVARPPRVLTARPVQLGGHALVPAGRGWRCTACRKHSASFGRLCGGRCQGSAASRWAARACADAAMGRADGGGHRRMLSGDVLWCRSCGAFSTSRAVGLARACTGRPCKSGRLARLLRGEHPTSCAALGHPLAEDGVPLAFAGAAVARPRPLLGFEAAVARSARLSELRVRVRARERAAGAAGADPPA